VTGTGGAASAYLPVWQERRASAVPVIRAALAAEGIASKARGMHVLSLLQTFAPYAPAEILVPEADAPRATAVLRHLLVGDELVERRPADAGTAADDPNAARAMLTPARRARGLAVSAAIALGLLVLARVPVRDAATPPNRRAKLEVIRVDDMIEPFATTRDTDVPDGIELRYENAPITTSHGSSYRKVFFARVALREGEAVETAIARGNVWVQKIELQAGARFAWEADETYDPDTGRATVTGARTFVLVGDPIITTDDVVEAVPAVNDTSGIPDVYVSVTVRPEAGERFGDATREWTNRRIAILLDGRITSAPVVKSEIRGGRMSITMGSGDPERQMRDAKALARGLAPAR
jgi:hypothetical protein